MREWPTWPYETTCGYLPFDPIAAFSGPTGAEFGAGPAEAALRKFVEEPGLPWLKPHLWRKLADDGSVAEFVRGRVTSRSLEWLAFGKEDDRWEFWSYSSDCDPTSVVGDGPVVTWSLATRKRPWPRWVHQVRVNLGPGPCSGGRPQNPRARVGFRPLGDKLLLTIWLRPLPPGVYTCLGLSEPPLTVKLPKRVRLSHLLDGGAYPPTPALGG